MLENKCLTRTHYNEEKANEAARVNLMKTNCTYNDVA